jgi:hypothetical protein
MKIVSVSILTLLILSIAGCSLPATSIQVIQFEQAQIETDKNLTVGLLNDRIALIQGKIDNIMKQAIEDAKAVPPAQLTGQWVAETFQVVQAEQEARRAEMNALIEVKETVIRNSETRTATLDRLTKLVTKSQQWSSETADLVTGLLETIKKK